MTETLTRRSAEIKSESETTKLGRSVRPPLRLAVVSLGVPPSPYGQSRVLGHLLADETSDTCLLLSENPPTPEGIASDRPYGTYQRLAGARYALRSGGIVARFAAFNEHGGLSLTVWQRGREIARAARSFRADVIIGCTASPTDVPAAALAAAMARVPFIAYLFDDPVFQWRPGRLRRFAGICEPIWVRAAAGIIAPNEFMARDFAARTGRHAVIVRNPVADAAYRNSLAPLLNLTEKTGRIVYTGTVYDAQADAFINLLQALEGLDGRMVLDVYTNQTPDQVAAYGVAGRHLNILPFVGQEDAYAAQRQAAVLFLPLAFRSSIPEVLRSSAPAKLGEFLASGRPILVHAPADTFLVEHVRRYDAATIVDTPDPHRIAAALERIRDDPADVDRKIQNALQLAEIYRAPEARRAFRALLTVASRQARR